MKSSVMEFFLANWWSTKYSVRPYVFLKSRNFLESFLFTEANANRSSTENLFWIAFRKILKEICKYVRKDSIKNVLMESF